MLGKVYVARQVMAATTTYHAIFSKPPAPILTNIQKILDGFTLGAPIHAWEDDRPLTGRPAAAVVSLPFEEVAYLNYRRSTNS